MLNTQQLDAQESNKVHTDLHCVDLRLGSTLCKSVNLDTAASRRRTCKHACQQQVFIQRNRYGLCEPADLA